MSKSLEVQNKLNQIQQDLKAPKGQKNTFGNYQYRSCEDILEAVKPLLGVATVTLSDEVRLVGERVYIMATATLYLDDEYISVYGWAREALAKKGMDEAQVTGAASSYARKYALNGLFAIDDTKDADTDEAGNEEAKRHKRNLKMIANDIDRCTSKAAVRRLWSTQAADIRHELKAEFEQKAECFPEEEEIKDPMENK